MASLKDFQEGHFISKKGTVPTNADNQLPYEEQETEKDDEQQDTFSLICLICEPLIFTTIIDQQTSCNKTQRPVDAITDISLYLSKRVLLI